MDPNSGQGFSSFIVDIFNKNRLVQVSAAIIGIVVGILILILVLKPFDKISNTILCLSCHSEVQDSLKKKEIHQPFEASLKRTGIASCTDCHNPHGKDQVQIGFIQYASLAIQLWRGEKIEGKTTKEVLKTGKRPGKRSTLNSPAKTFCYNCHKDDQANNWRNAKYQHPPFKRAQCNSCHDSHASNYVGITRQSPPKLCPTCHSLTKWTKRKYQHSPFKRGGCADCHSPHATNVENHLRKSPKVLCSSCHRNIARQFNLKYKMEPFEQGKCPKCHNPHASNYRKLWQAGPAAEDLCFKCHDGSQSKTDIKRYKSKPYQMKPFKEGKCLDCHNAHASTAPWLWKIKEEYAERFKEASYWFCLQCHKEYEKNYPDILHSKVINKNSPYQPKAGAGMCINCHVPHGSDYYGLIYKESIKLCTTCHVADVFRGWRRDVPRPHIAHPVGTNIKDPWRGQYMRCASCHNPMGSGLPKLRRKSLDSLCLQCHNVNDPSWIKGLTKKKKH